jgi:hypothetical protein
MFGWLRLQGKSFCFNKAGRRIAVIQMPAWCMTTCDLVHSGFRTNSDFVIASFEVRVNDDYLTGTNTVSYSYCGVLHCVVV